MQQTAGAPDYAEDSGGNFWDYGHAGFCELILAGFSDGSHLVICRFAPCGIRRLPNPHYSPAPGYRRRRHEDVPPCSSPGGKKVVLFLSAILLF